MKITTTPTPENIAAVLDLLAGIPDRLQTIANQFSLVQLITSIGPGARTPTEILAHIINCEAVTAEAITLALLKKEPLLPGLHPERDLGKLLNYHQRPFPDLLAYFTFRLVTLLDVLRSLTDKLWSRTVREEGKKRRESIYWLARGQAIHEDEHLKEIEGIL